MNEFLHRLKEIDPVLLVHDTRQHEAVEAGRPYQQLQEAGIATARLDGWLAAVILLWLGWRIANPAKEAATHAAILLLKST
jgi:hypothetical protein